MKKYKVKRIFSIILLRIVTYVPMSAYIRTRFALWGGVKVSDIKHTSIGEGVIFDSLYPENIILGKHIHIAMRCIILTHSLNTRKEGIHFESYKVELQDDCFIGANTVICAPVVIGKNAIVGAGSVVTKNIPDNEIWAGTPARFIKKRMH